MRKVTNRKLARSLEERVQLLLRGSHKKVGELKTVPYTKLVEAYQAVVPEIQKQGLYTGQRPFVNDWFSQPSGGSNCFASAFGLTTA